ncbi:nuclear pore complex protein An-Nup84 [Aspergillus heteromorphus CBS 117.55]|uniref:Nuclear pore complex protein n=1 Tax=Aspergillus heteromorphus CBS 117.55 TaxID=1448321 RepID=A0A317WTR3_9EURO|nr:nuclear pore complex protein An-Nup84 [Aspergillus heteromorphus CBS 117.55]PWY89794.1 nuclear pore complex protein An-Nup84 [Aspergillus heteromorphus CBS 117.55]
MAPLSRPTGSGAPTGFTSVNPSQPPNDAEVIEIEDDDDDEPMDDEGDELEPNDDEDMEDDYVEDDGEEESENESAEERNRSESPLDLGLAPNGHSVLDVTTPDLFTSAGAQEALHPLRRTADRVTRQIEAFAEKLDRFKQQGNRSDDFGNYQAAYQLVKSYQTLAQDAISDISKQNTLKRAKLGFNASRSNGPASFDPKTEEELQRLQLEADTWRLLLNLISIDDPPHKAHCKKAQETVFQNLHRYSSDSEVWEQFLSADHYAAECVIILKWLEQTAKSGGKDMDALINELETQSERGQGMWTHGWLYTKEAIKGQKRLRAWPQPLEPNDPGITASLSSDTDPLVTQLDPDAVTRQKRTLQKQDQFYERATWMTCWKMLRHGEDWSKIREWCTERLENWRAVSICGSSVDVKSHTGKTPVDDGHTRMMNWRTQESWRAACAALTHNPHTEDFERAVYSLLCGETEAAFKVCQTWDDYLYVYFNNVLITRYQGFCKQFQRKLSHSPTAPVAFVPEPAGYADVNKFVQYTKGNDRVGGEARNPYRTIQATIIGKSYDSFFWALAKAVSQVANNKPDTSNFVPDVSPSTQVDDNLVIAAEDGDALRIATHLYIIACSTGYVRSDTQFYNTACVNVVGYIANLEEVGVVDIVPLYASLLPENLAHSVLAQVLIEIVDSRERKLLIRLMEKHEIDVEAVLQAQWNWVSENVSAIDTSRTIKRYPKVVIRGDGNRELMPVRKDFIGTEISGADEHVIRSLEWLRYVDGQWGRICQLGTLLYRKFYLSGKLSAARELSRRMRLADLSQEAFGFDISEFTLDIEAVPPENYPSEPASPSKTKLFSSPHKRSRSRTSVSSAQTNLLILQSQTMRDLEVLILAFDSLENFAVLFEKLEKTKRRRDSGTIKDLRVELQGALDETSLHIDAMLDEWLVSSENETERAELDEIRNTYLPELFLEYHSAMYFSAHVISSELLVQCMNLATQVSEVEHLTSSFVASRRMRELMDALAISSKAMVNTQAKPGVRLLGGESLGIWTVPAPDEEQDGDTPAQ